MTPYDRRMTTTRTRTAATLAAATLVLISLVGCGGVAASLAPEPTPTIATATAPDVVGMSGDKARDAITAAGFTPKFDGGSDGIVLKESNWIIDSQDPVGGTEAEEGSVITMYASKAERESVVVDTAGLGSELRAHIDASNPPQSIPSWWLPVTEIEDVSSGTVRIYVQERLTDEQRSDLARSVRNFAASDASLAARLGTIVVQDLTGIDTNHYG